MIRWFLNNLTPPLLMRALTRGSRRREETKRFAGLYACFMREGDLCFDVGANLGNRIRAFRQLNCRVIAIEPQTSCLHKLRAEFQRDTGVVIVPLALGRTSGSAVMHTSDIHTLSTLSQDFISSTTTSGRFSGVQWSGRQEVQVSTLDRLIAEHGKPKFLKIDVEGHEAEVLAGLSQPIDTVSVEWTPEMPQSAIDCMRHLARLGDYEFNYSWGESMRLARLHWIDLNGILSLIEEFSGENQMFGDIYARIKIH